MLDLTHLNGRPPELEDYQQSCTKQLMVVAALPFLLLGIDITSKQDVQTRLYNVCQITTIFS